MSSGQGPAGEAAESISQAEPEKEWRTDGTFRVLPMTSTLPRSGKYWLALRSWTCEDPARGHLVGQHENHLSPPSHPTAFTNSTVSTKEVLRVPQLGASLPPHLCTSSSFRLECLSLLPRSRLAGSPRHHGRPRDTLPPRCTSHPLPLSHSFTIQLTLTAL